MGEVPEFVYVTVCNSEWPVTITVDYRNGTAARHVESDIQRRWPTQQALNVARPKVYRARLTDVVQMNFVPSHTVEARLFEEESPLSHDGMLALADEVRGAIVGDDPIGEDDKVAHDQH